VSQVGLLIFPFWTPHFVVWTPHFGWIPRLDYIVDNSNILKSFFSSRSISKNVTDSTIAGLLWMFADVNSWTSFSLLCHRWTCAKH